MLKQILKNIGVIVAGILILSAASFVSAWTAPTAVPPNNNVVQPLNVSSTSQVKAGSLTLGNLALNTTNQFANALLIPYGKIGIGDNTPDGSLRLDVEGPIGATTYCDQNGANCKTTSQMGGTVITGYCIQCWGNWIGWSSAQCASFGAWTGLSELYGEIGNGRYDGCRILIY